MPGPPEVAGAGRPGEVGLLREEEEGLVSKLELWKERSSCRSVWPRSPLCLLVWYAVLKIGIERIWARN